MRLGGHSLLPTYGLQQPHCFHLERVSKFSGEMFILFYLVQQGQHHGSFPDHPRPSPPLPSSTLRDISHKLSEELGTYTNAHPDRSLSAHISLWNSCNML